MVNGLLFTTFLIVWINAKATKSLRNIYSQNIEKSSISKKCENRH